MARTITSEILQRKFHDASLASEDAQASPFTERLARALEGHPVLGPRLRHAEGIVADLDYTLVESKPAFQALNTEVASRLGVKHLEQLAEMDDRMRGQPLSAYLKAFHEVCYTYGSSQCSFPEFIGVRQGVIDDLGSGRINVSDGLNQVPDSFLLITVLSKTWGIPLKVCTHCPRPLATAFVRDSGFGALVSPGNMVCGDDSSLAKDSPEYWKLVVPSQSSQNWVGLDDTADGASWMLRAANLGLVIVRPSSDRYHEPLLQLKQEFGGRLYILQEFGELFSIGRGEGYQCNEPDFLRVASKTGCCNDNADEDEHG